MGGAFGLSGWPERVAGAGGRSGRADRAERVCEWAGVHSPPRPFGQMIWPFENRPFFNFRPKIQLGLLKIRLYAVRPNLTLAFRVSAFRYKPYIGYSMWDIGYSMWDIGYSRVECSNSAICSNSTILSFFMEIREN